MDDDPRQYTAKPSGKLFVVGWIGTIAIVVIATAGLVLARARKRTPRERGRRYGARLVWLLPLLALGCNGSSSTVKGTPPGAYQVVVTATAVQGTAQLQHQLAVSVEVH